MIIWNSIVTQPCKLGIANLGTTDARQVGAGIFDKIMLQDTFWLWWTAIHEGAVVFTEALTCELAV